MTNHPIRHRIERTKNKHSRAVIRDGTIIIRLARGLTTNEEKEHVDDLLGRMTKQLADDEQKVHLNPFGRLLDSGESSTITLATGRKYRFTLRPGKRTSVRKSSDGWKIIVGPNMRRSSLHRLLWKTLSAHEQPKLESVVAHINNETFGVHISSVRLKFASSQWGSCSTRGVIMLNSALLFADPKVLKYVIIHELAHRKRADHSPQYWNWVGWAMPNYQKVREMLYEYRLPTL